MIIAAFFGILWLIITPPFQSPDEDEHFIRAYQIAQGDILAQRCGDRIGGEIPRSIFTVRNGVNPGMKFNHEIKQSISVVIRHLREPLKPEEKIFYDFPFCSYYSPIGYIPQIIILVFGKFFQLPPLILMYLGRMFNLIFWIAIIYHGLVILPHSRRLFFLIALLPTNLYLASTVNMDATLNALTFSLLCYVFYLLDQGQKIKLKQIIMLATMFSMIVLIKPNSITFFLIFLFFPQNLFSDRKQHLLYLSFICVTAIASWGWWMVLNHHLPTPKLYWTAPQEQVKFVISNPLYFLWTSLHTLWVFKSFLIKSHIGAFGWCEVFLPNFTVFLYLGLLLYYALVENHPRMNSYVKIISLLVIISNYLLVGFLLYVSWNTVGENLIRGLQGRYYIQVAPLVWLLFSNQQPIFRNIDQRLNRPYYLYFSLLTLLIATIVLLQRYYF